MDWQKFQLSKNIKLPAPRKECFYEENHYYISASGIEPLRVQYGITATRSAYQSAHGRTYSGTYSEKDSIGVAAVWSGWVIIWGEEAETEEISVLLGNLSLPETTLKFYENDDYLAQIAAVLQDELGLLLDGRWKFYIHYYTPEQDVGILSMTYWVDGIIATNRAVTIPIENSTVRTVIYSYLNQSLDEQTLIDKYEQFRDTHEQEWTNILGKDFEIDGESTLYSYNFRTDSLKYTYNIFFRHIETGIIDNSYGTEMVIK